ncbi:MAG: P-loop NTPase [Rhizomicrobium sp.]
MSSRAPRLTAIGSGKGGTGKTFISLSLAKCFARRGEKVLVCDADLGLSNTSVQLGLASGGNLPALLSGRLSFADAIVHVPGNVSSFDLLAAPAGSGQLADAGEKVAERLVSTLLNSHGYDRVVIDLGAGVGPGTMAIAAGVDDTLAVTNPDPAAITDAYAFVKLMARRTGGRMPSLIVNRASNANEAERTAEALKTASRTFLRTTPDYLGFVPDDPKVVEAVRRQKSLIEISPQSPAAMAVDALAELLMRSPTKKTSETAPSLR